MPRKSEATGPPKERKITTAAEGAKRPEALADKRSRMPQEKRKKKTAGPYCGPARLHYPLLLEIIRILELLDD